MMKCFNSIIVVSFLFLLTASLTHAQSAVTVGVHGSGTTNSARCYWKIMDQFRMQAKLPVHMTYRAVGSSTGQVEFFGDGTLSDNDFGSGDTPLNANVFDSFSPGSVIHLPVLLSSYGIYHSVPGADKLFLTPCVLARILSRQITDWNDPEIAALNPQLSIPSTFPITVARRALGSSTTAVVTEYLQKSCPSAWPESMVGAVIEWPEDTVECQGSGGMVKCLQDIPGAIGYLFGGTDLGEPSENIINEVALENADGSFLTSEEARLSGGVLAATENAGIPTSLQSSFADVNLINQPGPGTWPMVSMIYIYVKKDLTFIENVGAQTLLKAFLRAMYNDAYVIECEEDMGFVAVSGFLRQSALSTIDSLVTSAGAPEWIFEFNTERRLGQGDFVISSKRQTYAGVVQNDLVNSVNLLQQEFASLAAEGGASTPAPISSPPEDQASATVQQINSLQQDVTALTAQNEAASQTIEDLQTETGRLAEQNMAMAQLIEDLAASIANTTTINTEMMRRIEELETAVEEHSHDDEDSARLLGSSASCQRFSWMILHVVVGFGCWCVTFAS